ncbi:MAG: hypothetical protein AAGA86_03770, partial [Bacteroidota bacterium]
DYVGYGVSQQWEHPYTVHHELAEVSVDMLRATKTLLEELALPFSGNIFATGWSEGGGAGLALHKYVQTQYALEFTLKASSLFAGPYDYFTFFKDIFANSTLANENMSIYSWGAYAMNTNSEKLNQNANSIWSYSVSNQLDALDVPSNRPDAIFQTEFIQSIVNETDTEFITAIKGNSLLEGWIPQGRLYFHSGTQDGIVPHYNSTNAHQHFGNIGANSTLYEYPGGDHYTPLYDYVITTLNDFNTL